MTCPKGNSEFCFPDIEVEVEQNSLFPTEPVIKCFVIPPNNCGEIVGFTPAGPQICCGFKEHDNFMLLLP